MRGRSAEEEKALDWRRKWLSKSFRVNVRRIIRYDAAWGCGV